jgi:hypothetical protein
MPERTTLLDAYPVIARGAKLHPHAIGEGGTYDLLISMAEAGQPMPFVKMYCRNKTSVWADRVKALSPTTRVITRMAHGEDSQVNVEGVDFWKVDPQDYMDNLRPTFEANPEVDWWELWNEDDPPGTTDDPAAGHVQMARFALACMDIAEAWGVKLALMSYSSGVPENYEWQAMWERTFFFQRAKAGGHILSLHAYGRTTNPDSVQHHLLRPTWLYEEILIPNDCVVPFVFTEYSIHETAPGVGLTDWAKPELMAEYGRADELFGAMWYCLGASVFTFGLGWGHYNHNELWRDLGDLMLDVRGRENALPPERMPEPEPEPEPEPKPEPGPGEYDRRVMVVDFGRITDQRVRNRLYLEAAERGIFCGPSHDEAVNRPANAATNTVELPGFSEVDTDYIAWYQAHDPDVQLVFRDLDEFYPDHEG